MSIFVKIINGELPSYKISENNNFLAFLDISPLKKGHVLVIPKVEIDKFYDLTDDYLKEWMVFAKPIAKAIEKTFDCKRCGMTIIGLEVPHAHMHLMPISGINDMDFQQEKLKLSDKEMKDVQEKIIQNL